MTTVLRYPLRFYARPENKPVTCPDCSHPADPTWGDHGGECAGVLAPRSLRAVSAAELIRRHALKHRFLSMNELRAEFDVQGVSPHARGRAFTDACKAGHIRPNGFIASTDKATKGHSIRVYASLIVSGVEMEKE